MGRAYAGILGPLAFLTMLAHSFLHNAGVESTVGWASLALFAFAAIGFVAGELAGWIVDDSVRSRLMAEQARREATATNANAAPRP